MKANNTLKGQALHTYNRVLSAMAEDNTTSMCHTFAALTQQAKAIVLQSGKFANAYIRGELKGMAVEEAAKDLTARAAACVSCKVRNIDTAIATVFLAEYISRQRKEIDPIETTPATMNEVITNELNARNDRIAWGKAVTVYALELVESLDNWDKQPTNVAELREMMLNGASDWAAYSWGGCSLIYNWDIAERCCTASELKRVTRKDGSLRDMANAREHWLDVQTRALFQASRRVCAIAAKYFNA